MSVLDPGPRDHLITRWLEAELAKLDDELVDQRRLDPAEAPERLVRHLAQVVRRALAGLEEGLEGPDAEKQAQLVNELLRLADREAAARDEVALPPRILGGIKDRSPLGEVVELPRAPATPFSQSDLLVNAEGQPNIGSELRAELASADEVDLICAFVIWSGVVQVREALRGVIERGGRVRVITTTYMGVTEKKAVDELVRLGAEVRVAFDARTTKLHAKAWLLERRSGLTTAFVGSSNLSHSALFDGLEWNVRLSQVDAPHVIDRVRMTFESHWASEHFEPYHPERNGEELERALREFDRRSRGESSTVTFANLDVRPYPHQRRMLEVLMVERDRHDRHRNLVVAATGTGKTVVAALDYKQLRRYYERDLSLLFVAHRAEILHQALETYRAVLRDGSFGELHAAGRRAYGRHVFASVQSLHADRLRSVEPDAFDVVVIDEFHHAAAPTYDRLLNHLEPLELLGLTATPERLDGKDVTEWFGGRIAVELRLWEAIDQGFLVPFQYFGVADGTDLTDLTWRRGGYVTEELSRLYTGDEVRVRRLLDAIRKVVRDPGSMRALGFCVSRDHARYMARKFTEHGFESVALTGDDPPEERARQLRRLQEGNLRCVFSVDVLGEGVDVPNVDTVLLLRPTASPTVFTQQLGRGLRRAEGKSHLTVIDLIGQHRREFRFEDRLRAILDPRRKPMIEQVEEGFPFLPAGCTVDLDRQSRELILDNLRAAVRRSYWRELAADLRREPDDVTLRQFLERTDHRLEDVYRRGSWTELRSEAGKPVPPESDLEFRRRTLRVLKRLTHIDDPERVGWYTKILRAAAPVDPADLDERHLRLLRMLAWGLGSRASDPSELASFLDALWRDGAVRAELVELLAVLDERSSTLPRPSALATEIPLALHARYTRQEVVAALGAEGPKSPQAGVLWVPQARSDVFFVDLRKSERDYSPTTMYRDYAISRELFHWESQWRQHTGQPAVQRYINHRRERTNVLLFVRESKRFELGTTPYTFLGPVEYVDHRGERPVAFTWRLPVPMPEELFEVARSVAAA